MFISLAPHMHNDSGHDFAYHSAVEKAAVRLGMSFTAFVPLDCAVASLPSHWNRFFSFQGGFWRRLTEFWRLFARYPQNTLFFLESFNGMELLAISLAALRCRGRLWLLYRYDLKQGRYRSKILKVAVYWLGLCLKDRFTLLTDSAIIAQELEHHLERAVAVVPIPHTAIPISARSPSSNLRLWWPGQPRSAKGLLDIQRLCSLQPPQGQAVELIVADTASLEVADTGLLLRKINPVLSRAEYLHWMAQCDMVLLPYDPDVYRASTSGILVEAIMAGKIPLIKAGSWLAVELQKHRLEELILDWESPQLLVTCQQLAKDTQVKHKLEAMRCAYESFHSLEEFGRCLAQLL